jgi:beta-galactosidase
VECEGEVFKINGQSVKLRGVNRHDEHPDVGRATTREHWLQDLRLMKQANINYIRACHYQHAKGFIEMCDSMGFYVGSEVSLGGADNLMYDPAFTAAAAQRTIETVERDLNNPSIIYWSIGNEDSFTDMFLQMARLVKGLDPSRPMLLPWNADETLPEEIDILAPHYWTAREYDSIASQSKRPIITTEYVHAYGNQRMGGLQECWQSLTRHEAGAGGAVWMWADQGLKTPTKKDRQKYGSLAKDDDYLRLDAQGWDGITDSYRRPTRDYWEVKAVYCPITATLNDGKVVVYNGYDFLDMNTIHIKWQTFAEGKALKEGTATLDAKPHQTAILSVDSKKADCLWLTYTDSDGKEIGRQSIALRKTEMKKSRLALTIDPATGLPEGFRPTVWHKLNDGDQIIKNRSFAQSPEKYTVKVLSIEGNRSRVRYEINDSNSIEATYIITHGQHGTTIDYELTPRLQSTYVPVVGLAYKMKNVKTLKHWYGLGPDEAYPNKQAAPLLGLWNASQVEGTRRMQWVEVDGRRICCDGYLDRDDANAKEIRLLSHVLGRSEKGRLNYPEYQLPQGRTYKGSITIQ